MGHVALSGADAAAITVIVKGRRGTPSGRAARLSLRSRPRRGRRRVRMMHFGGGSEYPDVVPANGKVKVSARLLVSGTPDHCEITAQPSDF